MSTGLQDAFSEAAQRAQREFETHNAMDVIAPAARRVSRHRAVVKVGAGLASVAVFGGVVWGASALAEARITTIDPAVPTVGASGVPVLPTIDPVTGDNPDTTSPTNAWNSLDLAARALPRPQGSVNTHATAGMICYKSPSAPSDGSTTDSLPSLEIDDCNATWFDRGPTTSLRNWSVSTSSLNKSLTYNFVIHNDSDKPIVIDKDSVFLWIEAQPDATADTMATYSSTLVGTSMRDSLGDVTALLQASTVPTTIAVDGSYSSSITATTGSADGDPLGSLLASGQAYRVTVWARVHEDSPSGEASYLIQLGSNNDISCEFACEAVVNPDSASNGARGE